MICLDIWRQWYINIQAHFQWTNCPSYPIRWRELEADCCWFTFVLLWHVPYMQDTRCSSAKRLISATINVRSLEHSLMRNVTSCLLVNTCSHGQSHPASLMCHKYNTISAHPPLEFLFVVHFTKEPSVEAGSVRRFSDLCQRLGFSAGYGRQIKMYKAG